MAGTIMRRLRRAALWLLGIVVVLTVALAVLFALPVEQWRSGERFENTLPAMPVAAMPPPTERVWIDSDSACGAGDRIDPDDCLAILHLSLQEEVELVGLSTVFGNAPLEVTDGIARELSQVLAQHGAARLPVHAGAVEPRRRGGAGKTDAQRALTEALAAGPLTILALGPLTNVAAAIRPRRDLAARIERVVAVMGRRPGHGSPASGGPATRTVDVLIVGASQAGLAAARSWHDDLPPMPCPRDDERP